MHNNEQIKEGLSRAARRKSQNSTAAGATGSEIDEIAKKGKGRAALMGMSGKDKTVLSTIDLTDENLLYRTDRMLTKFEIQDSVLAKEIDQLRQREFNNGSTSKPSYTERGGQDKSRTGPIKAITQSSKISNNENEAHTLWLLKHGLGPDGQLPPVRV